MLDHEATGQQSFNCQKIEPIVSGMLRRKCSAPILIPSACSTWLTYRKLGKSFGSG